MGDSVADPDLADSCFKQIALQYIFRGEHDLNLLENFVLLKLHEGVWVRLLSREDEPSVILRKEINLSS